MSNVSTQAICRRPRWQFWKWSTCYFAPKQCRTLSPVYCGALVRPELHDEYQRKPSEFARQVLNFRNPEGFPIVLPARILKDSLAPPQLLRLLLTP